MFTTGAVSLKFYEKDMKMFIVFTMKILGKFGFLVDITPMKITSDIKGSMITPMKITSDIKGSMKFWYTNENFSENAVKTSILLLRP